MTRYEDYDTFGPGDEWDYNDEIGELFEKKYERGAISERPSESEAPDNAIWHVTDRNLVYRNDPSNGWVVINHGDEDNPVPEGHFESVKT